MGAGETTYEQISGPEDYGDVNPLSGQAPEFLQNIMGMMGQSFGGAQDLISSSMSGYDPNAFMQQFLGAVPGLMGATTDATSPLAQAHQASLNAMVDPTVAAIGQQLAPMGAAHSSAFGTLATEAMAPHIAQAATNLAGQQSNIFGNLASNAMGLYGQGNQFGAGLGMQGAGILGGLGSNLAGIAGGMVTPNMVGPTMGANYQPSWWEEYGQPLISGVTTGAMAAMGG